MINDQCVKSLISMINDQLWVLVDAEKSWQSATVASAPVRYVES